MFQVTTLLKNGTAKPSDVPVIKETGKPDYSQDFFGKPAFLTVSGQLNGEMYATALGKIYTFGPTFRAENSHTTRHIAEFWMIEPEVAFADLEENMDLAEAYLKFVVQYVLDNNGEDLEFFDKMYEKGLIERLKQVVNTPFKRVTYTEAVDILIDAMKKGVEFKVPVTWELTCNQNTNVTSLKRSLDNLSS
jgi:asparaginyl-tRNA synthetase